MPVEAFTVSIIESATEALITVSGELDTTTCDKLSSSLDHVVTDGVGDVVVDLRDVVFADSTAVYLLTRVSLELLADGRRLIVINPSRPVVRVLALADLQDWFAPREGTTSR